MSTLLLLYPHLHSSNDLRRFLMNPRSQTEFKGRDLIIMRCLGEIFVDISQEDLPSIVAVCPRTKYHILFSPQILGSGEFFLKSDINNEKFVIFKGGLGSCREFFFQTATTDGTKWESSSIQQKEVFNDAELEYQI